MIDFNTEKDHITKSELARRANVTYSAVAQACNRSLKPAVMGNKIDASHELVINYINKNQSGEISQHVRGPAAKKEKQKKETTGGVAQGVAIEIPENITAFVDMSLREIIEKFGTDVRFVDWLKATKSIEDINEKRLKNATTEGTLIDRDIVKKFILDPINATHIKLLGAGSKTLSIRIKAKVESGKSTDYEIETYISDYIESFIKPMKTKIIKALKNA